MSIADKAAFIRANTRLRPVPHAPEIRLHVADEITPIWKSTEEDLEALGLPPPFWAFAWAGGQALARYVLDHPATVADKTVIDFASGSGLVAIAAMKAGARQVTACEIDPFAHTAIALNAAANDVAIIIDAVDRLDGPAPHADVIVAGDIFYQRDIAGRVLAFLEGAARRGSSVLIGDPGRTYLPREKLTALAQYAVPVTRELEDLEIKHTGVWTLRDAAEPAS
ncbi:MAG: class I SAM-dependent methyltransferase [Labrys sp. (in: a-proteobacteria)]|jgi:predicted nicotinamide N-methyase